MEKGFGGLSSREGKALGCAAAFHARAALQGRAASPLQRAGGGAGGGRTRRGRRSTAAAGGHREKGRAVKPPLAAAGTGHRGFPAPRGPERPGQAPCRAAGPAGELPPGRVAGAKLPAVPPPPQNGLDAAAAAPARVSAPGRPPPPGTVGPRSAPHCAPAPAPPPRPGPPSPTALNRCGAAGPAATGTGTCHRVRTWTGPAGRSRRSRSRSPGSPDRKSVV